MNDQRKKKQAPLDSGEIIAQAGAAKPSEAKPCAAKSSGDKSSGDKSAGNGLRKAALEYFRPARVDDLIEVHTACTALTGVRMAADQKIYALGELLVRGTVEACMITLAGRPRRIPEEWRAKLAPFVCETSL